MYVRKFLPIIPTIFLMSSIQANAMTALLRAELKKLDPQTRLEQRCDIEAMEAIAKVGRFAPDKAIAYTFAEPIIAGNTITAPGASFRSRNHWYHLKFTCTTSNDKLNIIDFKYTIGSMIARADWQRYYLVP